VKTVQITETDLIPYRSYGLVCQGCKQKKRWHVGQSETKAVVALAMRRLGWIRIECSDGLLTLCPECSQVIQAEYDRAKRAGAVQ
jgi:hypothetical protein